MGIRRAFGCSFTHSLVTCLFNKHRCAYDARRRPETCDRAHEMVLTSWAMNHETETK